LWACSSLLWAPVGLLSGGKAEAAPGGLPACQARLATCTSDLGTCQTDLDACEAAPNVVFPGDGVIGPALSYTDNGDGTFTDNNTQLVWKKKDTVAGSVHNVENIYQWSSSGSAADGSLFDVSCHAEHCALFRGSLRLADSDREGVAEYCGLLDGRRSCAKSGNVRARRDRGVLLLVLYLQRHRPELRVGRRLQHRLREQQH